MGDIGGDAEYSIALRELDRISSSINNFQLSSNSSHNRMSTDMNSDRFTTSQLYNSKHSSNGSVRFASTYSNSKYSSDISSPQDSLDVKEYRRIISPIASDQISTPKFEASGGSGANSSSFTGIGTPLRTPYSATKNKYSVEDSILNTNSSKYKGGGGNDDSVLNSAPRTRATYASPAVVNSENNTIASAAVAIGQSSVGIIAAFRDLQTRARSIEHERATAIHERDNLRHLVIESQRNEAMWRSRSEVEVTEALLEFRTKTHSLRNIQQDVDTKLKMQEDIQRSLQEGINTQRQRILALENEALVGKNAKFNSEQHIENLKKQVQEVSNSNELKAQEIRRLKESRMIDNFDESNLDSAESSSPIKYLHVTVKQLERELLRVNNANIRMDIKCKALHKYMELILKINEDLTNMILHKSHSQAHILELADKYSRNRVRNRDGSETTTLDPGLLSPDRIPSYAEIMNVVKDISVGSPSPSRGAGYRSHSPSRTRSRSSSPFKRRDESRNNDTLNSMKTKIKKKKSGNRCYARSSSGVDELSMDDLLSTMSEYDPHARALYSRNPQVKNKGKNSSTNSKCVRFASSGGDKPGRTDFFSKSMDRIYQPTQALSKAAMKSIAATNHVPSDYVSYMLPTTSSFHSEYRGRGDSPDPHDLHTSFIPSGQPKKIEANIVAKVSKSTRAVKEINAAIASK